MINEEILLWVRKLVVKKIIVFRANKIYEIVGERSKRKRCIRGIHFQRFHMNKKYKLQIFTIQQLLNLDIFFQRFLSTNKIYGNRTYII